MNKQIIILACIVINLTFATAVQASTLNVPELGKVEVYPTYKAIGIEITLDKNVKNILPVEFYYKLSFKKEWLPGVELSFDKSSNTLRGSVFPCIPGENYDIKFKGKTETILHSKTLQIISEFKAAKEYYVSPDGNDNNPGTKLKPFKTISATVKRSKAAYIIYVAPGIYNETVSICDLQASSSQPLLIKSTEKHGAIIDGSVKLSKNTADWQRHKGSIFCLALDNAPEYITEDGFWVYQYRSLNEFEKGCPKYEKRVAKWKRSIPRAWYYDKEAKRLYLQTTEKNNPALHDIRVSSQKFGFNLRNSTGIIIDGFDIRNCSFAGIGVYGNSDSNRFINNSIHHNGIGITIRGNTADNNIAYRNLIYSSGILDYDWNLIKHGGQRGKGFLINAGRGNSIIENEIFGLFDGIQVVSWTTQKNRAVINRDSDIIGNYVHDGLDDGLEPDGGGINMRILNNRIKNINMSGISLAPIDRGPVYVVRNTQYNSGWTAFKFNVGGAQSNGACYIYHNSSYGTQMAMCMALFPPKGIEFANKVLKNNAFVVTKYGLYNGRPGNPLDYNSYWNKSKSNIIPMFWSRNNNNFKCITNFSEFVKLSGLEKHAFVANPLFSNPADGNFALQPKSSLIDKGIRIRGINDFFSGSQPDIGAVESGNVYQYALKWKTSKKIKLGKGRQKSIEWKIKNGLKDSNAIKVSKTSGALEFLADFKGKSSWGYAVKPISGKKLSDEKTREIRFMFKGDGSSGETAFLVMSGQDSFVHNLSLQNQEWHEINIPLSQGQFKDITSEGNGIFDISKIEYFGFFFKGKVKYSFSVKNVIPAVF